MFYVKCYVNTLYNNDKDLYVSRILASLQVVQIAAKQHCLRNKFYKIKRCLIKLCCYLSCMIFIGATQSRKYMNPSRATIPLIQLHQCDSEGGRIRGVILYSIFRLRRKLIGKIVAIKKIEGNLNIYDWCLSNLNDHNGVLKLRFMAAYV